MGPVSELGLSLRMLARDWRAGELRVLLVALLIAVASVTTVGFFGDRVRQLLLAQANQLMGADLVVTADRPLPDQFQREARRLGLTTVLVHRFPSMALAGERNLLVDVRAVDEGYPLKGELAIADQPRQQGRPVRSAPPPGTAWVDEPLLARLELAVGDPVALGKTSFRIAGVIVREPESAVGFINLGPRLIFNGADLPATQLIQPGSRINYRLMAAGPAAQVEAFRQFAAANLGPGQRVEGVRDARPEIRSALERAEKFLALSALASVVLAAVAVALAARRYLQRHFDSCAMMRCLGASQGLIMRLHGELFLALGVVASALGCLLGLAAQAGVALVLQPLVGTTLPTPGIGAALQGFATGFALLLGFAMPPLAALGRVPTLRVLRRDLGAPGGAGAAGYALGAATVGGLIFWAAGEPQLGTIVLAGAAGALALSGLLSWLMVRGLARLTTGVGGAWRIGLSNLRRRSLGTAVQVAALALGIMAMLLLTLVRSDLLYSWRASLPPDTPNRFLVNVQPDQTDALAQFFREQKMDVPPVFPMVRGRLVAINGKPISSADYADERAKRLIDREFNLSWGERMQPDNRIVAGTWWRESDRGKPLFSVEEGISQTLGIRMNDTLTYDVAGVKLDGRVASLRKVDWDSFRVNFFVIAPPGVLNDYPASYVTSFYLPQERAEVMNRLIQRFPNFLVIDVAAVLAQVQAIIDQVVKAVEFVFLFTLVAGLLVLYAAISATRGERLMDAAIMRTLGAARKQLRAAQLAEFAAIGALAGVVAALGASAVSYAVATRVLNVPFHWNPWVWGAGIVFGALGVAIAGWLGTRALVDKPPLRILNAAG